MKVLHTSDLHFGSTLNDLSRLEEHERFLDWLEGKIEEWDIDVLLLSGDIYDSSNPSSAARRLFFRLLHNLRQGARPRRVIVIGGNHDSPAVLNAPAPYLRLDGITVIGRASGDPAREVVPVTDRDGAVRLIVCAVPYLRESDLPRSAFGDDPTGAGRELAAGVLAHYAAVREAALEVERTLPAPVPLAAMGHLFARGVSVDAKDLDGEGPMVGSLGGVDAGPLAGAFDYTALGHIHAPQRVAGSEFARYSGSPLVMDFGERRHEKQVLLVTFEDDAAAEPSPASGWRGRVSVEAVPVPAFRRLVRVTGEDFKKMRKEVAALAKAEAQTPADLPTWVLADYKGPTPPPADWREQLSDAAVPKGGTEPAFVFAIMRDSSPRSLSIMHGGNADLKSLTPAEVFDLLLDTQKGLDGDEREMLQGLFGQILMEQMLAPEKNPEDSARDNARDSAGAAGSSQDSAAAPSADASDSTQARPKRGRKPRAAQASGPDGPGAPDSPAEGQDD